MTIWAFLVGLIVGFFPIFLILRLYKGKLLFISNTYSKGALMGFLFWLLIIVLLNIEAQYSLSGLLESGEGFGTIVVLTSPATGFGFITAGIAAAFASQKLKHRKNKGS